MSMHARRKKITWFLQAVRRCGDTDGRSSREELIWFLYYAVLIYLLSASLDWVFETKLLFVLLSCIPVGMPLGPLLARRLHDSGRSEVWLWVLSAGLFWGWAGLIPTLPVLTVLLVLPGDAGENAYGKSPGEFAYEDY